MKTITKRVFSWLLMAAMLVSLFPTAFALDGTTDVLADGNDAETEVMALADEDAPTPTPAASAVTYYVANAKNGGSSSNSGTKEAPFLKITEAIDAAKVNGAESVEVRLLSDMNSTQLFLFDDDTLNVTLTSDGDDTYAVSYVGQAGIGNLSGFIKVADGAEVAFNNVCLRNGTDGYDGRVIYAADGGIVSLTNSVVENGRVVNTTQMSEGGAGIYAAHGGTVNIGDNTVLRNNTTMSGGGAVYVADGGYVAIDGESVQVTNNSAELGGGIYVEAQTTEGMGGLTINGYTALTAIGVVFANNTAAENGGAMYLEQSAHASVAGEVTATLHKISGNANNIFLAEGATLDIADSTLFSLLGITAEDEAAYRLVSLPVGGYAITTEPAVMADEAFWVDDCETWDIRYMEYNGVPGLYLYYKTLDAQFSDVDTLTSVSGADINGEETDFLTAPIANSTNSNGVLTVPSVIPVGSDEDFVITFACSEDYRIPTEDVVTVTCDGKDVPFTYTPDFENGTAVITIAADVVNTLTGTVEFGISAEKYYELTVNMEGPLYTLESSITGLTETAAVLSENSKSGETAAYRLTRNGEPLSDVLVELYETGSNTVAGAVKTDAQGVASFSGLNEGSSYYPILKYSKTYRVIARDVTDLALSTLAGQTLASEYIKTTGTVSYDASTGAVQISNVNANGAVTFSVEQAKDVITFVGNEGAATTAPATLSMTSKEMEAGANTYGALATASMTGYDFDGWFTEAEGGEKVTAATEYTTGVSAHILYAHWTAREDTEYKVQHWVEYADGGVNCGAEGAAKKAVNGVTYYLYDESQYNDGTSDAMKDITALDLQKMEDATITWWTRQGFTASFEENCKVLADGSSVFSIYYDRNAYDLEFVNPGAGTATNDEEIDSKEVDFGDVIGTLPVPTLPGYAFGGWYDDNGNLVTGTDIYSKTEGETLTAHWNAKEDTKWAIKVMTQDIAQYEDGKYYIPGTYSAYKTVYKDNTGALLTGTTDTVIEKAIADIDELTFEGFHYVGYAAQFDVDGDGKTADTEKFTVTVTPTDASTDKAGNFNDAFDGGIVYLYYNRNTKDVTFTDGNGDDLPPEEIIYGGDFTGHLPEDPGKDGYDFDHWTDPDGNPVDENTPASDYTEDDGTVTVEPVWTAREYRLTYVPGTKATFVATDGGNGSKSPSVAGGYVDSKTVTYDAAMGAMPSASKTGYDFDGWFVENKQITEDTIVTVDNVVISNGDKNPPYGYEDTRPLYAKYTPHTYTLVLVPGASSVSGEQGSVSPERITVTYDSAVSGLPVPTLRGYRFVAWMLDPTDPGTVIRNSNLWNHAYTNGAEIPVYATWVPETYRYTFDLNDSIGSTTAMLTDTTIDFVEETFDSVYNGVFSVEAVRNGYKFLGWSLTRNGDVLTADDLVALATNATLYAAWEPIAYDVKLVMKGGEIADLTDNSNLETYDPTASYDAESDTWTIKVKFDTVYGNLPEAVKENCIFHGYQVTAPGWADLDGKTISYLPAYVDYLDKSGITLTAVWEPLITFDPNGAKFADDGSEDPRTEKQSEIETLPDVEKPDYTFEGWTTEDDPDTILDIDDVKALEEPVVLVPKFSANITFDANEGKMNGEATVVIAVKDLKAFPNAVRSGYTLDGWFTEKTGGEKVALDTLKNADKPMTVYAQWKVSQPTHGGGGGTTQPAEYEVSFDSNGGTEVKSQIVARGGHATKPVCVKPGYQLVGWFDGNNEFKFDVSTVTRDMKLTAHWKYVGVSAWLTSDHIAYISGYPDGTVKPEGNITRAEVAMIFYRLLNSDIREAFHADTCRFTDMTGKAWYTEAVATLTNLGVLSGYPDGTFRPNENITRAEFATICSKIDIVSEPVDKAFTDVSAEHWAYKMILSASEKGWISGYPDGSFRPDNDITRAETVSLVNRMLGRADLTLDSLMKDMKTWPDNEDTSAWFYLAIQEATNGHDFNRNGGTEIWTKLH